VRRYILISSGLAIVGNVGGVNSGVEITALGSPVNFLSRLDDATKAPGLAEKLEQGDILLCKQSAEILASALPSLPMQRVCLSKHNVQIRDFTEVDTIFILKPTDENFATLAPLVDADDELAKVVHGD
jgi:class 3 adenylate cyclase